MTYQFEISVFVTCFNKRPFIRAALQSLVDQKEAPHFELIILDDASTDGSWEEIQSFVTNRRNPTIKTFRNEKNEGLAAGMKQGISLASGKYFCRFDGDDFWYPNALQTLYFAAENGKRTSAFGDVDLIDVQNIVTRRAPNISIPQEQFLSTWKRKVLRRNFINGASFIAKTTAWQAALPVPEGINATIDWYFNISILANNSTEYIEESLAGYRVYDKNLHTSSLISGQKLKTWLILRHKFLSAPLHHHEAGIARRIRIGCEVDLLKQFLGAKLYKDARGCVLRICLDRGVGATVGNLRHLIHAFAPTLYNGVKAAAGFSRP